MLKCKENKGDLAREMGKEYEQPGLGMKRICGLEKKRLYAHSKNQMGENAENHSRPHSPFRFS